MTPLQESWRKPRSLKCARRATGRPSSGTSAAGLRHCLEGLRTVDHPGNAKTVGAHAEALRPEGLLEGHGHGAVLRQRPENAFSVRRLLDRQHDVEALGHVVAIGRCIATQQELLAEIEARVDDLVAHIRRSLLRAGGFTVGHREHDPAAENFGVEAESFAAVALEMQMRTGMHGAVLRCSNRAVRFSPLARQYVERGLPESTCPRAGAIPGLSF